METLNVPTKSGLRTKATAKRSHPDPMLSSLRTKEQRNMYFALKARSILSTRLFDWDCVRELGYEEEMKSLLNAMNLRDFVDLHDQTSPSITLEFLSTLQVDSNHSLSFHLQDEQYTLSNRQLGEALKLPIDDFYGFKEDRSFNEHVAWKDLTGENRFRPKAAKSSSLNSFIHKYLHHFISYSILARGESHSNVRKLELFVLWCGVKGKQISLTKLFADQMLSITTAKSGKIRVGSYITIIARYLNVLCYNYSFTHILPS